MNDYKRVVALQLDDIIDAVVHQENVYLVNLIDLTVHANDEILLTDLCLLSNPDYVFLIDVKEARYEF